VIVATIGSIYRDAGLLGAIRCVVIDEAHLVKPEQAGKYRRFLNELAQFTQFAAVGLTATPFRGNGVWLTQGKDPLFAGICHETKIADLIEAGYLAPLALPDGGVSTRIDTDLVTISSTGDYAIDELEAVVDLSINDVAAEAVRIAADRRRVIAFTPAVASAERLADALSTLGWRAAVVCGATPKRDRERLIAEFRAGRIRCLVTVLALATGFDVPDIDCIIWARPTRSPCFTSRAPAAGCARQKASATASGWIFLTRQTGWVLSTRCRVAQRRPRAKNSNRRLAHCARSAGPKCAPHSCWSALSAARNCARSRRRLLAPAMPPS
jgi:DNA repair protein RadD